MGNLIKLFYDSVFKIIQKKKLKIHGHEYRQRSSKISRHLETNPRRMLNDPFMYQSASCSVVSDSFDPVDCSPPGSSVQGILHARILEWVAIPFSRESSQPGGRTQVSCIKGRFFTIWAAREALSSVSLPCAFSMTVSQALPCPWFNWTLSKLKTMASHLNHAST